MSAVGRTVYASSQISSVNLQSNSQKSQSSTVKVPRCSCSMYKQEDEPELDGPGCYSSLPGPQRRARCLRSAFKHGKEWSRSGSTKPQFTYKYTALFSLLQKFEKVQH